MDERDRDCMEAIATNARMALRYADEQGRDWLADAKTVDAIAKRLDQVGELAKRVSPQILAGIPDVDWRGVKGFREFLVHAYSDLDLSVLADVVGSKLPALLAAVEAALVNLTEG